MPTRDGPARSSRQPAVEGDGVDEGFEAYVLARGTSLLRLATLLTGDGHEAEDLVQLALLKASDRWRRVARMDHPDAYVRRVLLSLFVSSRRRRWHGERATADLPEPPPLPDPAVAQADRDATWQLLATLPTRQRAVLVLRYYEDLDDTSIAEVLGCGASTVRSQAARALATLRTTTDRESR